MEIMENGCRYAKRECMIGMKVLLIVAPPISGKRRKGGD